MWTGTHSQYSGWLRTERPGFDPPTEAEDFSSPLHAHEAIAQMGSAVSARVLKRRTAACASGK
jgi:hypothetical protein